MAHITFIMHSEKGHLLPTFKLATALENLGHRVCYLTDERHQQYIEAQGHAAVDAFTEVWKDVRTAMASAAVITLEAANARMLEHRRAINAVLRNIETDLFIVDACLPAIALMAHAQAMPEILLHTNFDTIETGVAVALLNHTVSNIESRDFRTQAALQIPELVLCPREFDFPRHLTGGRILYYIGASIDMDRSEQPFSWERINEEKPLIYCSMGSQAHAFKESRQFFQTIINAMRDKQRWQMILSVGKHLSAEFENVPENVLVVNWVPQLEVLKRASLMITHGGLGTVKECIYFGVPMIVFPVRVDQPQSAARVVYHGLGVRGDFYRASVEQIHHLLNKIESNSSYKEAVGRMAESFKSLEESNKGVRIVEKMLRAIEKKRASKAWA